MDYFSPLARFFRQLQFALLVAESDHEFPGKALRALARAEAIPLAGNSGFVVGIDITGTVEAYVAHIYKGTPAPDAIVFAERGY